MKSIQKFTPKTNEFLTALRNLNQDNYKASPKLERSPSDRGLTQDKVDLSSSTKLSESESFIYKATPQMERSPSDRGIVKGELSSQNSEKEYVSVVISSGDPKKRSALLSANTAGSQEDKGIPKNLKIDRTLSSGDIVARVDKKLIGHLEGAGFKVTNDEQQFVLPIMPGDSSTKSRVRKEQPAFTSVMKLDVVNASTRLDELKTTGKGISIAILDTGVAPHPDIENKIVAFKDFVNDKEAPYDDNGHGTHVAGDAAGTGVSSGGKYKGTAPDASIVGVKVLNNDGGAKVSDIIEGIDWVIQNRDKYNIRIINMSIGVPSAGFQFDPIDKAVERAVNAGIVVVAAAGNEGPKMGTIGGAPGNSPLALTVGAIDDKNTIDKSDDEIAPFSSRGPTMDGITKPDLVAPGTNIISLNIKDSQIDKIAKAVKYLKDLPDEKLKELPKELFEGLGLNPSIVNKSPREIRKYIEKNLPNINYVNEYYVGMPGTSMAAPITAGIVANLLEVNPQLSPGQVKDILTKTADDMGLKKHAQGAGSIDPPEAVQLASDTQGELPEIFARAQSLMATTKGDIGFLMSGSAGGASVKA